MRAMTVLVAAADGDRLHAALSYAAAGAAMGRTVQVHLHEGAVGLLRSPVAAPADPRRARSGLPTLAQLLEEVFALDVRISVCQSGLALAGLRLDQLDPRIEAQGPIGVLSALGDGQLLIF